MDLQFEVLVIISSYLTPNDIMEISVVCKLFYHVSRKIKLFVKKLNDSRELFKGDKLIFDCRYNDVFISFSNQLFVYLEKHVNEENLFLVKDVLMDRLYYSVLPFRVWNHLFMCERLNSMPKICGYFTKLCIKNKKISDHINNNLFVHINEFSNQLKQGIIMTQKVPLLVDTKHANIFMSNDRLNFGSLWCESIDSSFML